jgi:hypothetical protein
MTTYTETTTRTPMTRNLGLTGQLVVGGTLSTGLLLGGFAVALLGLAGRTSGHALLATSMGLFLVGATVGLVISALVGTLGRDDGTTLEAAGYQVLKGILYALPAIAIGAMLAGWIALAVVAVYLGKVAPLAGSAVAAAVALTAMGVTARLTWEAAANTLRRVTAS